MKDMRMQERIRRMRSFVAILLALWLVVPGGRAFADPVGGYEAQIGETQYETLADAVDAAQDGDVIELLRDVRLEKPTGGRTEEQVNYDGKGIVTFDKPGTYTLLGNGHTITRGDSQALTYATAITVHQGVTLNLGSQEPSGKSALVIDGEEKYSTHSLVYVDAQGIVNMYEGVTIQNSHGHGGTGAAGAVVYGTWNMYGGSFVNNHSKMIGGAIGLPAGASNAELVITGGTFENNNAPGEWGNGFGGAIFVYDGQKIQIKNATFEGNKAEYGGAIYAGKTAEIQNCTFTNNHADENGGAILAYAPITVTDSTFTKNEATYGGAIFDGKDTTITNSTFKGNNAQQYGGALYVAEKTTVQSSLITKNQSSVWGGGIYVQDGDFTVDDRSAIFLNEAKEAGDDAFILNEKAHEVKLPTGQAMNDTGKAGDYLITGWYEDGYPKGEKPGVRYDAKTHAKKETDLVHDSKAWAAALKVVGKKSCTIAYVMNRGEFVPGYTPPTSYVPGEEVTLPTKDDVQREGYIFEGWYEDKNFDGEPIAKLGSNATGNKVFYAKWCKLYTLTFVTNGGNTIPPVTKPEGTIIDLGEYKPTRTGYDFKGWYLDEDLKDQATKVILNEDRTVYAKWEKRSTPPAPDTPEKPEKPNEPTPPETEQPSTPHPSDPWKFPSVDPVKTVKIIPKAGV